MQHANVMFCPFMVFLLRLSTKYRLVCTLSDFVLLLLFADASCLLQLRSIWGGGNLGSGSLGESRKFPQRGLGQSCSEKRCLVKGKGLSTCYSAAYRGRWTFYTQCSATLDVFQCILEADSQV